MSINCNNSNYVCVVESITDAYISGYAFNKSNYDETVELELHYGKEKLYGILANIPRIDLVPCNFAVASGFTFHLSESVFELLSDLSGFEILLPDGTYVSASNTAFCDSDLTHYKTLLSKVKNGNKGVSKWGEILDEVTINEAKVDNYFSTYRKFNEVFFQEFGENLFINYGTLLGYIRNRRLISWDDDLDFGFFINSTSLYEFKNKFDKITSRLIELGYEIEVLHTGQFKWHDIETNFHLDCFAAWVDSHENLNIYFGGFVENGKNKLLPLVERNWYNNKIFVPNDPIAILQALYGEDWIEPKKNFSWTTSVYNRKTALSTIMENVDTPENMANQIEILVNEVCIVYEKLCNLNKYNNELKQVENNIILKNNKLLSDAQDLSHQINLLNKENIELKEEINRLSSLILMEPQKIKDIEEQNQGLKRSLEKQYNEYMHEKVRAINLAKSYKRTMDALNLKEIELINTKNSLDEIWQTKEHWWLPELERCEKLINLMGNNFGQLAAFLQNRTLEDFSNTSDALFIEDVKNETINELSAYRNSKLIRLMKLLLKFSGINAIKTLFKK